MSLVMATEINHGLRDLQCCALLQVVNLSCNILRAKGCGPYCQDYYFFIIDMISFESILSILILSSLASSARI